MAPLSASLKDLVSVVFDLEFVEKACSRLLAIGADTSTAVEQQALWISAVVVYARCVDRTAKRSPLPQSVLDTMNETERATHDRMIRERNKYVAHVEYTREEIMAIERVEKSATAEAVAHQIQFRRFTHDPDEVRRLMELAGALRLVLGPVLHEELAASGLSG